MACLRAVCNYALLNHPLLKKEGLENPVNKGFKIRKPKDRADRAMAASELRDWYKQLQEVKSEIRWHIPCPKGGTERAFDIPLSRRLCWLLAKVRRVGRVLYDGSPYVFAGPSDHIVHSQEKKHPKLAVGHALRHTYYSIAVNDVGIDQRVLNALVNHKNGGLVDTYFKADWAQLLKAQEQVSAFLWKAMTAEA
ncbi:MAG TPA: hypothetical protein VLI39_11740 [Sedimentisphaerales bacterium]|nr:hypothetical protein [Sedimentisphaerales bacterium]